MTQNHRSQLETQCRLYLLDELGPAERDALEAQMTASGELINCLAEQAELLAAIGESAKVVVANSGDAVNRQTGLVQSMVTKQARLSASRLAILALATAACIVFCLGYFQFNDRQAATNDADTFDGDALAHAWAVARSGLGPDDPHEPESELVELELVPADDEIPSWLTLGVANQYQNGRSVHPLRVDNDNG